MPAPQNFEPYWHLILADMRRRIASGEWPPGHKLPATEELRQMYDELFGARSNTHVRRAIKELVGIGELRTHPGAGVWVIGPKKP